MRGPSLAASMSEYLIHEMESVRNLTVRTCTEVVEAHGGRRLEQLTLRDLRTEETRTVPAAALFVLIGAQPHTEWLAGALQRDTAGYVLTGRDVERDASPPWRLQREPHPRETSLPGVFAAGDDRHGSVKRMASAVGEGAVAVQHIQEYLAG